MQLQHLDLRQIVAAFESARGRTAERVMLDLEPVEEVEATERIPSTRKQELTAIGTQAIRDGAVGAVIMSGGQGTRLGFAGAKGMYSIGMVSGKSIFQLHVEKVGKIRSLCADSTGQVPSLPIYVMTSDLNDQQIRYVCRMHLTASGCKHQLTGISLERTISSVIQHAMSFSFNKVCSLVSICKEK
jgi:UDP-N-acetylglucosamine/UDP-N-acetylgalactosamine diphosphorylase